MIKHNTWHIHITGLVQGVGFRPFVYNLATSYHLYGWVKNDHDGIHIEVSGLEQSVRFFYRDILDKSPELALIVDATMEPVSFKNFKTFIIIQDSGEAIPSIALTPDFATCPSCLLELQDRVDRRHKYPFISCSSCGPRYSIIRQLPFEREHTTMYDFDLCSSCLNEYQDPKDRRFYIQTNSCATCGIHLRLFDSSNDNDEVQVSSLLEYVSDQWKEGKIIAIKGIGGYLLTCDATNEEVIAKLRERKKRPDKPLALMYPNIEMLSTFHLNKEQLECFLSTVAPIILLDKKDNELAPGICDHLSKVGIMLPYAPLFHLLLSTHKGPIVATSGNQSSNTIIYKDEQALSELSTIADYILVNNREIIVPQDDSVIVFSDHYQQKVIIRRSRGLAPSYYDDRLKLHSSSVLAMGADLKSTFAMQHKDNTYISQYIGDLENYNTQQNFEHSLEHLTQLLQFTPSQVMVDVHPGYVSSTKGDQIGQNLGIPIIKVQHHKAHFSALLGEHALLDSSKKILGVIWDGIGWGSDGAIWGSEFMTYQDYNFNRVTHLDLYPHIANDKMAKEPRLAALSMCHDLPMVTSLLQEKFSKVEWKIYQTLLAEDSILQTSSMGRLFDAVSSLLGICDVQTYEGHAASLLQVRAEEHLRKCDYDFGESYYNSAQGPYDTRNLMSQFFEDLQSGADVNYIAAKFHITLVHWIQNVAKNEGVQMIGCSGGVFQNTLLIDLIIQHLGDDYELLLHKNLSPNDENVSFGQLIYATIEARRLKNP